MTADPYAIPRPAAGDVVELILDDHLLFESLLRDMRRSGSHRDAARTAFAELHVAHARAEEEEVLPQLNRKDAISDDEQHHGEEEHAEGHEELLALMECAGTDTQKYDDALEKLNEAVMHHLCEEEMDVLNAAREDVGDEARAEMGAAWAARRNELLDAGCASVEQLRQIVVKAEQEGLLDDE